MYVRRRPCYYLIAALNISTKWRTFKLHRTKLDRFFHSQLGRDEKCRAKKSPFICLSTPFLPLPFLFITFPLPPMPNHIHHKVRTNSASRRIKKAPIEMHLELIRFLCHSSNHAKNRFLPCNIRSLCTFPQLTCHAHSKRTAKWLTSNVQWQCV